MYFVCVCVCARELRFNVESIKCVLCVFVCKTCVHEVDAMSTKFVLYVSVESVCVCSCACACVSPRANSQQATLLPVRNIQFHSHT